VTVLAPSTMHTFVAAELGTPAGVQLRQLEQVIQQAVEGDDIGALAQRIDAACEPRSQRFRPEGLDAGSRLRLNRHHNLPLRWQLLPRTSLRPLNL